MSGKRIVLWVGSGANHKALAAKISSEFTVVGIVIDRKVTKKKTGLQTLLQKVLDRLQFREINNAWFALLNHYNHQYPAWPNTGILELPTINDDRAYTFTEQLSPDLIVVSGTSLVRKKLVSFSASIGIINLHTGLSPYVKGGPNCTNWCIANNERHLIGNTIMWLSEGIDSGNIIATELTPLGENDSLFDIHLKVMEHGHSLYLRTIRYLFSTQPPYQSVPQKQLGAGKLYLNKMWDGRMKRRLLNNLKENKTAVQQTVPTIPLP